MINENSASGISTLTTRIHKILSILKKALKKKKSTNVAALFAARRSFVTETMFAEEFHPVLVMSSTDSNQCP